jgi:DNA-binding response OmpR family regulator
LLARIRAMSRRSYALREYQPSSLITVGPLCIDALHNKVTAHGKTIRLTATESKILHFLAIHMDDVCTAGQIVTYVWGYEGDGNTALIKAHILHLRQKIEPDPSHPRSLLTVPGVGYTLIGHSDEETNTIATAREKRKQRSQSVRVVSNGTYGGS